MQKDLEQLFKMEIENKEFQTKEINELCNCNQTAKAHIREMKIYEVDILETAQEDFERWLPNWFKVFNIPLKDRIFKFILTLFGNISTKIRTEKLELEKKSHLNMRNFVILKVNEDNKPDERDLICKKCNKRIPISWQ